MLTFILMPILLAFTAGIAASGALKTYQDYNSLRRGDPALDGYLGRQAAAWTGAGLGLQEPSWWNHRRTARFIFQVRGIYHMISTAADVMAVPAGAAGTYQLILAATGSQEWASTAGLAWMLLLTAAIFRYKRPIKAAKQALTMRLAGRQSEP